eukprot:6208567-Pleurochrysis_carterae.AAC.5
MAARWSVPDLLVSFTSKACLESNTNAVGRTVEWMRSPFLVRVLSSTVRDPPQKAKTGNF